jgi:hypothetical protein
MTRYYCIFIIRLNTLSDLSNRICQIPFDIVAIKLRWLRLGGLVHGKDYTFRSPFTKARVKRMINTAQANSAVFPMDLDIVRFNFRTRKAYEAMCVLDKLARGVYDYKIFL